MEEEQEDKRLNWQQACRVLGCGKSHFYRLVASGALPAWRLGSRRGIWVYEGDCKRLLQQFGMASGGES